jgi:predicted  nucleic acid-binding Zn-ribbon protein
VDSDAAERARKLERLEAEERAVSARRRRLQDRIDFLRGGGGGPVEDNAELIEDLVRQEREVSVQRRAIHQQIEIARAELLRPG